MGLARALLDPIRHVGLVNEQLGCRVGVAIRKPGLSGQTEIGFWDRVWWQDGAVRRLWIVVLALLLGACDTTKVEYGPGTELLSQGAAPSE